MSTPTPRPVVTRTIGKQIQIVVASVCAFAGVVLRIISENSAQIATHYAGVKWMGDFLFVASFAYAVFQKTTDIGNIVHTPAQPIQLEKGDVSQPTPDLSPDKAPTVSDKTDDSTDGSEDKIHVG